MVCEKGDDGTYWPAAPWAKGTEVSCWSAIVTLIGTFDHCLAKCGSGGQGEVNEVGPKCLAGAAFQTAGWAMTMVALARRRASLHLGIVSRRSTGLISQTQPKRMPELASHRIQDHATNGYGSCHWRPT